MMNTMNRQLKNNDLRHRVRITKALNPDFTYCMIAEIIGISVHSFYNWLSQEAYNLSSEKEKALRNLLDDLAD